MTAPLSERLQATAHALDTTPQLTVLADAIDVDRFVDALEHAAALAAEAEHDAVTLANAWGLPVADPIPYPPLVALLGRAITTEV